MTCSPPLPVHHPSPTKDQEEEALPCICVKGIRSEHAGGHRVMSEHSVAISLSSIAFLLCCIRTRSVFLLCCIETLVYFYYAAYEHAVYFYYTVYEQAVYFYYAVYEHAVYFYSAGADRGLV